MRKNAITLIFSIIVGVAFVFFTHFGFLQKVPGFRCEGFGCIGLGIFYFVIGLVLIPIIFGILGFVLSKENRWKQAFSSLIISLAIMALSLWTIKFWNDIDVRRATEESNMATQELYQKTGIPLTQQYQELPLLDNRRPITVVNQLTNPTTVSESPFKIQAYAREDATLSDGTLQSKIWVFVPGSTEKKDVAIGKLVSTQNRSSDGRTIFEGTITLGNTFGASGGYLSVIGKDGVTDSIEVSFR